MNSNSGLFSLGAALSQSAPASLDDILWRWQWRKVDLDSDEVERARKSRNFLLEQLEALRGTSESLPVLTGRTVSFGSFARRVKIRPLDDIDEMIIVHAGSTTDYPSTGDPTKRWLRIDSVLSPLNRFRDNYGYVNSTSVLNAFKASLGEVKQYSRADISKNMQAVTLQLSSHPWNFDVVPAVEVSDGRGGIAHYLIPDGYGDWIRTDPRIDALIISAAVNRHSSLILSVIRLARFWNKEGAQTTLPSYYLEQLFIASLRDYGWIFSTLSAFRSGLSRASTLVLMDFPDPKGLGMSLNMDIDSAQRISVSRALQAASDQIGTAQSAYDLGYRKTSIRILGEIFGEDLSVYDY